MIVSTGKSRFDWTTIINYNEIRPTQSVMVQCKPILKASRSPNPTWILVDQIYIFDRA